jgi:integrase
LRILLRISSGISADKNGSQKLSLYKLSDRKCRVARPRTKPYRLNDGHGLQLWVMPTGGKYWRLRYRINKHEGDRIKRREGIASFGAYPEVGLEQARELARKARDTIKKAVRPREAKAKKERELAEEASRTFESVARLWLAEQAQKLKARTQAQRVSVLERDVFPAIGRLPVGSVSPPEILAVLKSVHARTPTIAAVAARTISSIYRYAVANLIVDTDPTWALRGALSVPKVQHARPFDKREIARFMQRLEQSQAEQSSKMALMFMLRTTCRTQEILDAQWTEIDWEDRLWRIPHTRMKSAVDHVVPLASQALTLLEQIRCISGEGKYLFPSSARQDQPMSRGVLWYVVRRLGYEDHSPHSVRATFSTIMNELGHRADLIERSLAHGPRDQTRATYNWAQWLPERRKLMQQWNDLLDELASGTGRVVPGRFGQAA